MRRNSGPRVLAVGLDAAEPALVRKMIDEGQLPALAALLARGRWLRVESPAEIGSGAVWPTFLTGTRPAEHGVYGEWAWRPETMGLARTGGRGLMPFWKRLAEGGATVGFLDVPFAPLLNLPAGFEVSEWGAHDTLEGRLEVSPPSVGGVVERTKAHPFRLANVGAGGPGDVEGLQRLAAACLEGAALRGELAGRLLEESRPDLAVVVFTEVHRSSHYLWHTVEPEHPFYAAGTDSTDGGRALRDGTPDLRDIYRAADTEIGRLVGAAGEGAAVFVFALHGMRATRGVPAFLEPLLAETGWARPAGWRTQSWRGRALSLFAAAKRHAPAPLRKLYYGAMPRAATYALAQPTMMPAYDWPLTRAFALPTDQNGWVRINLEGREAAGVVARHEYAEVCARLEGMLRDLRDESGEPLVSNVLAVARDADEALTCRLPDLVVHYADAAFAPVVRARGMRFAARPAGAKFVGQHAHEGFLIAAGAAPLPPGESVRAEDLGGHIAAALALDGRVEKM